MSDQGREAAASGGRRLLNATAVMASGTMVSRILGFGRAILLAFALGNSTRQVEMFGLATLIPNTLYMLFAGGALNTVLVPQIVRHINRDDDHGEAYTNRIMTAFMLIVTAVAGTEGEGDQPSRFLAELGVRIEPVHGRPRRPLSLAALVAELRRTCADPESPPALREEAAARLARVADVVDERGRPLVPAADPARWWGMRELSDRAMMTPVTAPDQPIALSGSQLASLLGCPRQWFLSRKGQADPARNTAATFGSVIHVLADHGARADVPASELVGHLEQVWDQLSFDANWLSTVERAEAEAAIDRFVAWQAARPQLTLLGTEVRFRVVIDLGSDQVLLTGSADRVERDTDGRIRIVDFKTSRSAPQAADVAVQDQMGIYQLAVAAGAFDELAGPGARPGGAELVYLRLGDAGGLPRSFHQASLDDVPWPTEQPDDGPDPSDLPAGIDEQPTWVHRRLAVAAHLVRNERFLARVGPGCRWCSTRLSGSSTG